MVLPNASSAVIDPRKVREYLLSETHPVGRFKAAVFVALGYTSARWEVLRDDLLAIGRTGAAVAGEQGPYGQKYEVDGMLTGPSGRSAQVRTVWIVIDKVAPRFVTAFPR